jgi:hypothetical protein
MSEIRTKEESIDTGERFIQIVKHAANTPAPGKLPPKARGKPPKDEQKPKK